MNRIEVHPAQRGLFGALGLTCAADFLGLQGEIVGGHPDRHVLRLALGTPPHLDSADPDELPPSEFQEGATGRTAAVATVSPRTTGQRDAGLSVILKKEHRVRWGDRLAHAWLGFGWVSKSTREGRMLREAEQAGIGCPHALAWGEAGGQAFLLARAEPDAVDLRLYLHHHPDQHGAVARALGRAIARLHGAGFFHRDLSSKHVLITAENGSYRFCFLDWQRARRFRRLGWRQRLADLAMLDATVTSACATPRHRLACWRAYLEASARVSLDPEPAIRTLPRLQRRADAARLPRRARRPQRLLHVVCRLSARLQTKRRIRELRQLPLPPGAQNLIWLDGEALCVTRQFLDEVGTLPKWLEPPTAAPLGNRLEVLSMPAPQGRSWRLVRRWTQQPLGWLWNWLRRPLFPAPEFEHAAAIVRLERYGLEVPRLLALGHRTLRPWRQHSFLLLEPPADTTPLLSLLAHGDLVQRRRLLQQAGRVFARIHQAGYGWRGHSLASLAVRPETGAVVLTGVEAFQRSSGRADGLTRRDFTRLMQCPLPQLSATDRLRFALGYFGQEKLTSSGRALLRRLLKAWRRAARRRAWLERRVV